MSNSFFSTDRYLDETNPIMKLLNSLNLDSTQKEQAASAFESLQGLGFDTNRLLENDTLGEKGPMSTKDKFGVGLGIAQTGLNAYLGLKNLGLANKNYKLQRQAFNTNMENQKKTLNRQLEQQFMRSSFQDRLAPSKDAYMEKWGY